MELRLTLAFKAAGMPSDERVFLLPVLVPMTTEGLLSALLPLPRQATVAVGPLLGLSGDSAGLVAGGLTGDLPSFPDGIGAPAPRTQPATRTPEGLVWEHRERAQDTAATRVGVVVLTLVSQGREPSPQLTAMLAAPVADAMLAAAVAVRSAGADPTSLAKRVAAAAEPVLRKHQVSVVHATAWTPTLDELETTGVDLREGISLPSGGKASIRLQGRGASSPTSALAAVVDKDRLTLLIPTATGRLVQLSEAKPFRYRRQPTLGADVQGSPSAWRAADGLHVTWLDQSSKLWHAAPTAAPIVLAEGIADTPVGWSDGDLSRLVARDLAGKTLSFEAKAGRILQATPRLSSTTLLAEAARRVGHLRLVAGSLTTAPTGSLSSSLQPDPSQPDGGRTLDPIEATGAPMAATTPVAVADAKGVGTVAWLGIDGQLHVATGPGDHWDHLNLTRIAGAPTVAGPLSLHALPDGAVALHYPDPHGGLTELRRDTAGRWSSATLPLTGHSDAA